MKRGFWWRKQGAHLLFSCRTRVRNYCAANGGSIKQIAMHSGAFFPQGDSRLGSDGGRADGRAESDSGGDGLLANPRIVARRRFQTSGRRHRNRSGGFCCFSPPKSREKIFLNFTLKVCEVSGRSQFSQTFFFLYFWGQKYQNPPHVVLRGIARAAALHGARKIRPMCHPVTDAPQPAPSFSASNESADLLCRQRRHRVKYQFTPTDRFCLFFRKFDSLFSARRGPTWFRWRESGRRAESASGGDGLLANPRSRPTPLSDFRTPTSESVGWLLLLFAIEKQGKKSFFRKA